MSLEIERLEEKLIKKLVHEVAMRKLNELIPKDDRPLEC